MTYMIHSLPRSKIWLKYVTEYVVSHIFSHIFKKDFKVLIEAMHHLSHITKLYVVRYYFSVAFNCIIFLYGAGGNENTQNIRKQNLFIASL